MEIKPGQYYRCIKVDETLKEEGVVIGDVFCIIEISDAGKVYFNHPLKGGYSSDMQDFLDEFEYDPKGQEKREQRLGELMSELDSFDAQQELLAGNVKQLEMVGNLPVKQDNVVEQKKEQLRDVKNKMKVMNKRILEKREELKALLEEKKAILDTKLEKLQEVTSMCEWTIQALNLYLGIGTEITRLRKGKPCDASEKIKVRQRLLFMDEECLYAADSGGMDFRDLEEFDKWVTSSDKHLQQVLPEPKGLIAIRVRREQKDYGDKWANFFNNKENMRTYLLIRNGENLYRVIAPVFIPDRMFPVKGEFDEFFFYNRYCWDEGEHKKESIRPGTDEYMRAIKRCDESRRHYLCILLMLQGLMDKTKVFHPIEGDRVNLCDKREYENVLTFIHDDEMLLPTGRLSFNDWQKQLNEQLKVGDRIVGFFQPGTDWYQPHYDELARRIHPRRAHDPKSEQIYVLTEKVTGRHQGFRFLYERDETIFVEKGWDYEERKPKKRASMLVYADDRFILNFDAAKIEDIEFYIESRVDRHEYMILIPLLRRVLKMKKKEQKEEKPFVALLKSETKKRHGVQPTQEQLEELVEWWKFKNHTKRALKSDDTKALRMIVQEFGIRQKLEEERKYSEEANQKICEQLKSQPGVIYVGHKAGNEYIVLKPSNAQNIFVTEETWVYLKRSGKIEKRSSKAWSFLGNRPNRWQELWSSGRWKEWRLDLRRSEVLADSELEEVKQAMFKYLSDRRGRHEGESWRFLPVAMTWSKNALVKLYYSAKGPTIAPVNRLLVDSTKEPSIDVTEVHWFRKREGGFKYDIEEFNSRRYENAGQSMKHWIGKGKGEEVLWWFDEKADEQLQREFRKYKALKRKQHEMESVVMQITRTVEDRVSAILKQEAYEEFIKEEDPELWEDHWEKENRYGGKHCHLGFLHQRLSIVLQEGIDLEGKTIKEVFELAEELKKKEMERREKMGEKDDDFWDRSDGYDFSLDEDEEKLFDKIPMDFVISLRALEPYEDEDE